MIKNACVVELSQTWRSKKAVGVVDTARVISTWEHSRGNTFYSLGHVRKSDYTAKQTSVELGFARETSLRPVSLASYACCCFNSSCCT